MKKQEEAIAAYEREMVKIRRMVEECLEEEFARDGVWMPPHLQETAMCYLRHLGKCLRPGLLLLGCRVAGGNWEAMVPAACAMEMFHTWTLIHDDVIDHDSLRRNQPTAHRVGYHLGQQDFALSDAAATDYGLSLAILGGDLLQARAVRKMTSLEGPAPELVLELVKEMTGSLTPALLAGEQRDIELSHLPFEKLERTDVIRMMEGKTGALLDLSLTAGVALAEGRMPLGERRLQLREFAMACGIAFQLQDDILGIYGDERKLGKPIGSDVREGKRTLLAIMALENASREERQELLALLGNPMAGEREVERVRAIMRKTGALDHVQAEADRYVSRALELLPQLFPHAAELELLVGWTLSMTRRNR